MAGAVELQSKLDLGLAWGGCACGCGEEEAGVKVWRRGGSFQGVVGKVWLERV